ncbi:MAG: amino acid ABC transporter permease [Clostridiales bacterium]|nr:amino acid ABC transporter permease [Clostridiales bacterium]
MSFDFIFFVETFKVGLSYLPTTLYISLLPLCLGLVIGTLIAVARMSKCKPLIYISKYFVVIVRGIPPILMLLLFFLTMTKIFDAIATGLHLPFNSSIISAKTVVICALTVIASANFAETIRTSFKSVGHGQMEAAYTIGMVRGMAIRRIIIPQALPVAIPIISNTFISLVKSSSLAYLLTVIDVLNGCKIQADVSYKFLEAYVAAAVIYYIICFLIEQMARVLTKKVSYYKYKSA